MYIFYITMNPLTKIKVYGVKRDVWNYIVMYPGWQQVPRFS